MIARRFIVNIDTPLVDSETTVLKKSIGENDATHNSRSGSRELKGHGEPFEPELTFCSLQRLVFPCGVRLSNPSEVN
jgi:hypothetical protein